LFLGNQFPAEHSLCEEVTVLPRQGMEGTAVKKMAHVEVLILMELKEKCVKLFSLY
jgi:hypothetical protein